MEIRSDRLGNIDLESSSKINRLLYKYVYFFFDIKNHYTMYYLLGCISIFFGCQILKTSSLITDNNFKYQNCIDILNPILTNNDCVKVCEILNNQENYQNFVYNLCYTILLSYILIREVINYHFFDIKYWITAHISATVFSLIGEIPIFQFSIDSNTKYNITTIITIITILFLITILLIRQMYYCKIRLLLLLKYIFVYIILYILLIIRSNNIIYHFHHSLISGILSLCFTNFNSTLDIYIHAILTGIFIQGLNFYSLDEIFMFYISDKPPPNLLFISSIYGIFILLWTFLVLIKIKCCNKHKKPINEELEFSLIPGQRNIELYEHF